MPPAKMESLSTKKMTTAAALVGVLRFSRRAITRRTSRCHSRMLAEEMAAPDNIMAALRQPEPMSRASDATRPE